MGGTFGEIHGAKVVGLLRAAANGAGQGGPRTVLLLLDTGGVRLQEANAGELAVSEIIRAIAEARHAGVNVVALIGGRSGVFGGGGLLAAGCSRLALSPRGRPGVTGPEVIETNRGVEEFDSADRALVWRITGGRTRTLLGAADRYCTDTIGSFREAAIALAALPAAFDLATLQAEQTRLQTRLDNAGDGRDATDLWARAGIDAPVSDLAEDEFAALAERHAPHHDAR